MTIHPTLLTLSTVLALALAAPATATAQSKGPAAGGFLSRNQEAELHRTGQVALPDLHGEENGIPVGVAIGQRAETRVPSVSAARPGKTSTRISLRDNPTLSFQYGKAFTASVEECRFDVARRAGIAPAQIVAGLITLRWTIEPSGYVRDVSAITSSPTDPAVTACVKRLVAGRALLNPVEKPLALEWTYAFRKISVVEGPHEQ